MKDPTSTSRSRGLVRWAQNALAQRGDDDATRLGLAFLRRAEGVIDRLDGVAVTLQKVADLELALAQRMVPIVDDLGELVRHTLNEARERRGLGARRSDPVILEHDPGKRER